MWYCVTKIVGAGVVGMLAQNNFASYFEGTGGNSGMLKLRDPDFILCQVCTEGNCNE